jgi:hypothetical protein
LLIALGIYSALALGYLYTSYWSSRRYQAAVHWSSAMDLLGVDDGRRCSRAQLETAFVHLLETGRLVPEARWVQDRIEAVRWRFEERHFKLPEELKMRSEAVAALHENLRLQRQPLLVVGIRDRGWAPDQLLAGPAKVLPWAIAGAVMICLVWAWWAYGPHRIKAEEREEQLLRQEAEVKELGAFRDRPSKGATRDRR